MTVWNFSYIHSSFQSVKHFLIALLLSCGGVSAQEDTALARLTALKIQGTWQQTEQRNIRGEKLPGSDVLTLRKDFTYVWHKPAEQTKQSGKWKIDNYSKTSNTGKMMERLVLKSKSSGKTSIFIQSLSDASLVLRLYDYSQGAPSKDSFSDLHFKRVK